MLIDLSKAVTIAGGSAGGGGGGGGSDARYLGVYADAAALNLAHPTAPLGSTATVTSPNGNLFYYNGAWVDTGTGYLGDMLAAVYDPSNVAGDAFIPENMVEFSNVYRNTVQQNLVGGAQVITFDTADRSNAAVVDAGGGVFNLAKKGAYMVFASSQLLRSSSSGNVTLGLQIDTGGGFAALSQSVRQQVTAGGAYTAPVVFAIVETAVAGDTDLRFVCTPGAGGGTTSVEADSSLTFIYLGGR